MAVPATDVDICNLALDRLGQRDITSITAPTTETEKICARWYDATRQELLRAYIFNFSKKLAQLTKNAVTPAFGFATAYDLPADFIRLLALGDISISNGDIDPRFYELSEGDIFTDSGSDTDGLNITYVKDAQTIAEYDPLFVKLFHKTLAKNMAYKFTLKNSLIRKIEEEADEMALKAAAVSGQEKPPRRVERSRIIDVRRRGSRLRDNTFT